MNRRYRVTLIAACGLLLVTGGLRFASAQSDGAEGTDVDAAGEVGVERRASLTPAEQLAEAQEIQESGATLSRRVSAMLDEARQDRDIIRVTCLNDKLTQINANLRTLSSRIENLEASVEASDTDRGGHEYTVITVLNQKLQVLDQEASQCIGEDLFETGATTVTTEIDPGTPSDDPGILPPEVPTSPVPYIPPPASGVS